MALVVPNWFSVYGCSIVNNKYENTFHVLQLSYWMVELERMRFARTEIMSNVSAETREMMESTSVGVENEFPKLEHFSRCISVSFKSSASEAFTNCENWPAAASSNALVRISEIVAIHIFSHHTRCRTRHMCGCVCVHSFRHFFHCRRLALSICIERKRTTNFVYGV